jgi:hypothetical protein
VSVDSISGAEAPADPRSALPEELVRLDQKFLSGQRRDAIAAGFIDDDKNTFTEARGRIVLVTEGCSCVLFLFARLTVCAGSPYFSPW